MVTDTKKRDKVENIGKRIGEIGINGQ